jgi:hypothetical protein
LGFVAVDWALGFVAVDWALGFAAVDWALGFAAVDWALGFAAAAGPAAVLAVTAAPSGVVPSDGVGSGIGWTGGRRWLRRWGRLRGRPPRTRDGRGSVIAEMIAHRRLGGSAQARRARFR